ncbi:AAA family ATPase [Terrabacter sp. GCM10028922]|uniref:AAA family ATPase n=1 Tax=Terrabacter sp. GCM10028922 TaxID=3273428 RepID=UPI0036239CA9
MLLTRIRALNFLALDAIDLELGERTTITGPNNVGKSTVLAAVSLAQDAVAAAASPEAFSRLTAEWASAGHEGAQGFEVRVGVRFDEAREHRQLDDFLRAAWASLLQPGVRALAVADAVRDALGKGPAEAMRAGELVITHEATGTSPWSVAWEFAVNGSTAHVRLAGPYGDRLIPTPARHEPMTPQVTRALAISEDDPVNQIRANKVPLSLASVVSRGVHDFTVDVAAVSRRMPEVSSLLAAGIGTDDGSGIRFAQLLHTLLARNIVVTPNHRSAPEAELTSGQLHAPSNLRDGTMLVAELYRLKNGSSDERAIFARAQQLFTQLTGQHVDCTAQNLRPGDGQPTGATFLVAAVLSRSRASKPPGNYDVPLRRSGAGDTEALYLAALMAQPHRTLLLDEPAIHLSPTAQRRLHRLLRADSSPRQVVLVTHSPDMVAVSDARDLAAIVRLSRDERGVRVDRIGQLTSSDRQARTLLSSSAIRSVLFAAGVLLVEGGTEAGLVDHWTSEELEHEGYVLPSRDDANIALLSVEGENNFGVHVGLLGHLGIPFAVLADGPALRPGRRPANSLAKNGLRVPSTGASLADVRGEWERAGVFTLAAEFGDGGDKAGEIESFLTATDACALKQARREVDATKGALVGAAFAASVPAPPSFVQLWGRIVQRLARP